jgi:hypothetical protein
MPAAAWEAPRDLTESGDRIDAGSPGRRWGRAAGGRVTLVVTKSPNETQKARVVWTRALSNYPGDDLLSRAAASAVPSALEGLTSVFGMGTGVAPPVRSPGIGKPHTRSSSAVTSDGWIGQEANPRSSRTAD